MGLFSEKKLETILQKESQEVKRTILIVDDEPQNLITLHDVLVDHYEVLTATDGQEALELLQSNPHPERIHLIISDQRMPNMTGVEFLTESLQIIPRTIRMILTGYTDVDAIMDSINQAKLYKFILKPFDRQDILLTIQRGLEAYDLEERNRNMQTALKFLNEKFFTHIRSILQGVVGSTELLNEPETGTLNSAQQGILQHMKEGTHDLIHLLDKTSELSYVYMGNFPVNKEQLDIVRLIREVGDAFQREKTPDQLALTYDWSLDSFEAEGPPVHYLDVDQELFCKALAAILENAYQYSNKPVAVKMTTRTHNNQFLVDVHDDGIGIEQEGGEKLMMPFTRGERCADYQPFGLGIGLAKAKACLEAQGGELSIIPQVSGSTVALALPNPFYDQDAFYFVEEPAKILIFQENESELQLYQDALELEGHDVLAVQKTEDLASSMAEWQPDLVFLDAHSQDSEVIVKQIRDSSSIPPPVIMIAETIEASQPEDYLQWGAQDVIFKPIEYEQLTALIQQWV